MISKTLIVLIVLVSLYALCLANYNTIPQQQPYHSSHQQQQQPNDMIHISQIQAFTVYKNQYTTSRRGQPVLQMKCVGGDAQLTGYHPDVIQCKNVGFDGISVQWECQASMDDKYKLGKVHVNCEGYAGPGDANVLKGSCSVDYELMYTEKGRRINQQQPSYTYNTQHQRPNTYPRTANPVYEDDSGSGSGVIMFLVIVAVLVFVLVALGSSKVPNSSATTSPTYVPPYNPNIYPDVRSTTTPSAPSINPTTAFVGGFATGAATGYMAGRASNNSTHRRNSYDSDTYYGTSTYSNTTNTSYSTNNNSRNSDEKSGEHVSKSFGGSSSR